MCICDEDFYEPKSEMNPYSFGFPFRRGLKNILIIIIKKLYYIEFIVELWYLPDNNRNELKHNFRQLKN